MATKEQPASSGPATFDSQNESDSSTQPKFQDDVFGDEEGHQVEGNVIYNFMRMSNFSLDSLQNFILAGILGYYPVHLIKHYMSYSSLDSS